MREITRKVGNLLFLLAKAIEKLSKKIDVSKRNQDMQKWVKSNTIADLRLDYDLHSDSLVFDLGGYKGEWTEGIFSRYCCNIFVFEPVPEFADRLIRIFKNNIKIKVFSFGLSNISKDSIFFQNKDGSSAYNSNGDKKNVKIVDIEYLMESYSIETVDLIKINIEGGEYDLIEYLVEQGLITKFKNIQVQFHDFIPNAQKRMELIRKHLSLTHEPTYIFDFIWENWKLKQNS